MKTHIKNDYYQYKLETSIHPKTLELVQHVIYERIYYFGNQFSRVNEKKIKNIFKKKALSLYKFLNTKKNKSNEPLIFSNSYFDINNIIEKNNFKVVVPWWTSKRGYYLKCDLDFHKSFNDIFYKIKHNSLCDLSSASFLNEIKEFKEKAKMMVSLKNFKGAFFSNDLGFFERLFIDVFKELNIPTFIFLHGLPARYNDIDDNRADYLIVWGEQIKKNYISGGVNCDKILVSGHPSFLEIKDCQVNFDMSNILVLTKPMCGSPSISNNVILSDRGNCIKYLESIRSVLVNFGINHVKLRLHPSENIEWYSNNINNNFFKICNSKPLEEILEMSTLVIGPTSTVFLESLYNSTNYIIYEPQSNGLDILNYPVVDPFDKNNNNIEIAANESELNKIIKNKYCIPNKFIDNYIKEKFDFEEVLNIIK
jgi:hypothetical protein